eukprot:Skav231504  [mRNA]  locus=scaffold84:73545:73862:- [translate_table: standard]
MRNVHENGDPSASTKEWLTRKEIAKKEALTLGDPEDEAELKVILKSMTSRPHELPDLAQKGLLQHRRCSAQDIEEEKRAKRIQVSGIAAASNPRPSPKTTGLKFP